MTPEDYRKVCSRFATGIAVLTACDRTGNPHGLTVNSFTSISAAPPLVLVCIDLACGLLEHFELASHFGLSFLAEDQEELSSRFAFVPERRFDGVAWRPGHATGVPVLSGSLASLELRTSERMTIGDHRVLIGEVVDGEASEDGCGRPLLYFGSTYQRLESPDARPKEIGEH